MDCCPSTPHHDHHDHHGEHRAGRQDGRAVSPDAAFAQLPRFSRRTLLKGAAGLVGTMALSACGLGGGGSPGEGRIKLAFCSQLLCVTPYEFTRERGHFADEGLDVELVYSEGGSAALQALVAGGVDYAATSFDAAVGAFQGGGDIRRFASTGRLPLFALATAPQTADEISQVADLADRTVAISSLGNADHTILLYLLNQAGVDPDSVEFATLGTNIYDALRIGETDAGMVQEPALSMLQEDGGGVIANLMDLDDAEETFGGPYEFMGVSVRADEREERADEMRAIARALQRGLEDTRSAPVSELVDALPGELIAGEDRGRIEDILAAHRDSLYPEGVEINVGATERVLDSLDQAGALEEPMEPDDILDLSVVGEAEREAA